MHALLVVLILATPWRPERVERIGRSNGRGGAGAAAKFFEFAPAAGTGMTAPCACTNPTGTKSEALTFTRSSSAWCAKQGYASTGIADGDLVLCSANKPRVEMTSDGGVGLLVEGAATNILTQPRDVGAWTVFNWSVAASVTADAGTRVDGTSGGWRVDMPACVDGDDVAQIYLPTSFPSGVVTCSLYLKGLGAAGATYLWLHDGSVDVAGKRCEFADGQWTRCTTTHTFASAAPGGAAIFGNNRWGAASQTANTDATSFIVDMLQCEAGSVPSSFAEGTRTAETPYYEPGALEGDKSWSVSLRFERPAVTSTPATTLIPLELVKPATYNLIRVDRVSNTASMYAFVYGATMPSGGAGTIAYTPALTASTAASVLSLKYDTSTNKVRARLDGTNSAEGAVSNTPHTSHEMTRVYVGYSANYVLWGNGIVSQVCVDQTATGCFR